MISCRRIFDKMPNLLYNGSAKQPYRGGVSFYNLTWGKAPPVSGHGVPVGCLAVNDELAGGFCMANHKCMDCGGSLSPNSADSTKRCNACHFAFVKANASPTKPCLDCGKQIRKKSTRCMECYQKLVAEKKAQSVNHCIDCGTPVLKSSTRCWDCSVKAKKGSIIGDGPALAPRQVCPTCGGRKDHRSRQCLNCAKPPKLEKFCIICGKPTDPRAKAYCQDCWSSRPRHPNLCLDCGTEISRGCLRCSICYGKYRTVTFVGEDHPGWMGGDRDYPSEFNDELREFIRSRDDYQCQECGVLENGAAHHCHHIDYDKYNNDPSNLISLCCSCHSSTNGGNANRAYWTKHLQAKMKGRATWKQLSLTI